LKSLKPEDGSYEIALTSDFRLRTSDFIKLINKT